MLEKGELPYLKNILFKLVKLPTRNYNQPIILFRSSKLWKKKKNCLRYSCINWYLGYLQFTWKKRKFRLENQMFRAIPFGKLRKRWTVVIWFDGIFLLFSVCSADLDILWNGPFYHLVKFYSFMFMNKISMGGLCKWVSTPGLPESSPGPAPNLIFSTVQRPIFSFT